MASSKKAAKVAKESASRTKQEPALEQSVAVSDDENEQLQFDSIPWIGKVIVFVGFPTLSGSLGLYLSYLKQFRKDNEIHEVSFDRDFVGPFLLGLALTVVVAMRTAMFRTNQMKSVIAWPKVRRVKKIVYKSQLEQNLSSNSTSAPVSAIEKKKN